MKREAAEICWLLLSVGITGLVTRAIIKDQAAVPTETQDQARCSRLREQDRQYIRDLEIENQRCLHHTEAIRQELDRTHHDLDEIERRFYTDAGYIRNIDCLNTK